MLKTLVRYLGSYTFTIIALLLYALLLAIATWVERTHGPEMVKTFFYHSPALFLLYLLLVFNFLISLRRRWRQLKPNATPWMHKVWQWSAFLTIHLAFLVILAGATWSHLYSKEGLMHIREGEKINYFYSSEDRYQSDVQLPFSIELKEFRLIRYPGSGSPASYESDLLIHDGDAPWEAHVYMNNVLDLRGYRFYQSSYDEDEKGTILSVSLDRTGTTITYIGYALLIIGFLLMLFVPTSHFRHSLRKLRQIQSRLALCISLLCLTATIAWAGPVPEESKQSGAHKIEVNVLNKDVIPLEHAHRFGLLPLQWQGRIVPLNTLSTQLVRKLTKEHRMGDLHPDQFLLSYLALPEIWMGTTFIPLDDDVLAQQLHLTSKAFAFAEVFDSGGRYKLAQQLSKIHQKDPNTRNKQDKELLKLDERINILYSLYEGRLINIFPDPTDATHTWYAIGELQETHTNMEAKLYIQYLQAVRAAVQSGTWNEADAKLKELKEKQKALDKTGLIQPRKISAEQWYNESNLFAKCRVGYFITGGLLLLLSFIELTKGRTRFTQRLGQLLTVGIGIVFLCHLGGMGLRWYISGYAPWSNSYETMVYVALATIIGGFLFGWNNRLTRALATLFGGVILFVSGLNWMDPQITTLVPVLRSPWLMFHVAVIVAAYGFFGIGFLLGLTNITLPLLSPPSPRRTLQMQELDTINHLALLLGLAFMTIGTFLGAIWANESWGRYWGWDPKETWALITLVIYAGVTHLHLTKWGRDLWLRSLCSILAFYSVIMTFFGVNMYLSGMHSYGSTDGATHLSLYLLISFLLIVALALPSALRYYRSRPPHLPTTHVNEES